MRLEGKCVEPSKLAKFVECKDVGVDVVAEEAVVQNSIPVLCVFIYVSRFSQVLILVKNPISVKVHMLGAITNEKLVEAF